MLSINSSSTLQTLRSLCLRTEKECFAPPPPPKPVIKFQNYNDNSNDCGDYAATTTGSGDGHNNYNNNHISQAGCWSICWLAPASVIQNSLERSPRILILCGLRLFIL